MRQNGQRDWSTSFRSRRTNLLRIALICAFTVTTSIVVPARPAFAAAGEILTYAGGGNQFASARGTSLAAPRGVVADRDGNYYFSESGFHRIRTVDITGRIKTVAGTGDPAEMFLRSGGALSVPITNPTALALDASGTNLYLADTDSHAVRKVDLSDNSITTIMGDGVEATWDPWTDGITNPTNTVYARLGFPEGLAVTGTTLFVSDYIPKGRNQSRKAMVWKVDLTSGETILQAACRETDCPRLKHPAGLSLDPLGNLLIADKEQHVIFKIPFDENGDPKEMVRLAGKEGQTGNSEDGIIATDTYLNSPHDVVAFSSTITYLADTGNHAIRKVENTVITTVAGRKTTTLEGILQFLQGFDPEQDSLMGTEVLLNSPKGVGVRKGNVILSDTGNHRVRELGGDGRLRIQAGLACCFFTGDGGSAVSATLFSPRGLAIDDQGQLLMADPQDNRIRVVDEQGVMSTHIGMGEAGKVTWSLDPGLAPLNNPGALAYDPHPNRKYLYVADEFNSRVLRKDRKGALSVFQDSILQPSALAVDGSGNLYVSAYSLVGGCEIRRYPPQGDSSTLVHSGNCAPSPSLALDGTGSILFTDKAVIWKKNADGTGSLTWFFH